MTRFWAWFKRVILRRRGEVSWHGTMETMILHPEWDRNLR